MDISIAGFSGENISGVAQIERACFSEPWSEKSLELLFTEGYPSFVAVCGEEVLGYVSTCRSLDELQMINLAVREDARGLGIAKRLLAELDRYSAENGIFSISLEVRESNTGAIKLYESCHYENVGIRKNFYRRPVENGIIMIKKFEDR